MTAGLLEKVAATRGALARADELLAVIAVQAHKPGGVDHDQRDHAGIDLPDVDIEDDGGGDESGADDSGFDLTASTAVRIDGRTAYHLASFIDRNGQVGEPGGSVLALSSERVDWSSPEALDQEVVLVRADGLNDSIAALEDLGARSQVKTVPTDEDIGGVLVGQTSAAGIQMAAYHDWGGDLVGEGEGVVALAYNGLFDDDPDRIEWEFLLEIGMDTERLNAFEVGPVVAGLRGLMPVPKNAVFRRLRGGIRGEGAAKSVEAAGLAVLAADTGRVLMLQRALDDTDPASGMWEFPGGGLEDGEDPLDAAKREWSEETGCELPSGKVVGEWHNGVYCGYIWRVRRESAVAVFDGRGEVANPDDPDGDRVEALAWWDPEQLTSGNPGLRSELRQSMSEVLTALAGARPREKASVAGVSARSRMPEQLRKYWLTHEAWGESGAFDACTKDLREHGVPAHMVDGACANLHKEATGRWPSEKKTHGKAGNKFDPSQKRDDKGKWTDGTPGVDTDKLKIADKMPAGVTLRSSRKAKSDNGWYSLLVAEVDTPDGPRTRIGVLEGEGPRKWGGGFGREQRMAELREVVARQRALQDADSDEYDEDARIDAEHELEDLADNKTASLAASAVASLRIQLAEALAAARRNKSVQEEAVRRDEILVARRDHLIDEHGDPDLEERIRHAQQEVRHAESRLHSLRNDRDPSWAEFIPEAEADAAEAKRKLEPLLAERVRTMNPAGREELEQIERDHAALMSGDIDDILVRGEVQADNGLRLAFETWGSDDIDEDWTKTYVAVLDGDETFEEASESDRHSRSSGPKGIERLLEVLGDGGTFLSTFDRSRPAARLNPDCGGGVVFFSHVAATRARLSAVTDVADLRNVTAVPALSTPERPRTHAHSPGGHEHNQQDHARGVGAAGLLRGVPVVDSDEYEKAYGNVVDEATVDIGDGAALTVRYFESSDAHVVVDLPGGKHQVLGEMLPDSMRALAYSLEDALDADLDEDPDDTGLVWDTDSHEHDFYVGRDATGEVRLLPEGVADDDYLELSEDITKSLVDALREMADGHDTEFEDEATVEVVGAQNRTVRPLNHPGHPDQKTHGRRKNKPNPAVRTPEPTPTKPARQSQSTFRKLSPATAQAMQNRMVKDQPWSDANRRGLRAWTSSQFHDIRGTMRDPDGYEPYLTPGGRTAVRTNIRSIHEAMRPLPRHAKAFRKVDLAGLGLSAGDDPKALVGQRRQNPNFTATSVQPGIAFGGADRDAELEIDIPAGTRAAYIASVSELPEEGELLLDAGAVLEFTTVRVGADGRLKVKARVIP